MKDIDKKLMDARRYGHAETGHESKSNQSIKELKYGLIASLLALTVCLFFYFTKDCQDNLFFAMSLWFFISGVICDIKLIVSSYSKAAYYLQVASKTLFCLGLVCTILFTWVNL